MIIEFLTKKVPFSKLSDIEVVFAITSQNLTPDLNASWDSELCEKLTKCWAIEPSERPSMEDLLIFFATKLEGEI
jgi:serine/threonine protein kinase